MDELTVTQHNALIEARYRLSLDEQRLVIACIAQIDPRKPLPKDAVFTLTAAEFAKLYGLSEKNAYEQLREAVEAIGERWIYIHNHKSKTGIRWIDYKKYYHGEGYVRIGFSRHISPYLSLLHKDFTSCKLKHLASFKTTYAVRMYELLSRFKDTGQRQITISHLKDCLGIEEEYPRFADLKRRVIEPASEEINAKSDLTVTWKPIKKGRLTVAIDFSFELKQEK